MKEIWKDIKGYEGYYQVSNLGNIKSLPRNGTVKKQRIMKNIVDRYGYQYLQLMRNNQPKKYKVHRLVAIAFISNLNNLPEVNHKDGNKKNNVVDNLEWCTQLENRTHAFNNKLSIIKPVNQLDKNLNIIKQYNSIREANRMTKIDRKSIILCCKNKQHFAGGYCWEYVQQI